MLTRGAILFCCLAGASLAITRASRAEQVPPRALFAEFPRQMGAWKAIHDQPIEPKILAVLGADDYLNRVYTSSNQTAAGLYVGYYRSQRQGDAIHSPLNCLPGSGWEPVSKSLLYVTVATDRRAETVGVNRYVVAKGLDRQLVLYWYQSHGRVIANEYWSKLYLVADAIRLNRTDAALVRVIVPVGSDSETKAEETATAFVSTAFPVLRLYLPN